MTPQTPTVAELADAIDAELRDMLTDLQRETEGRPLSVFGNGARSCLKRMTAIGLLLKEIRERVP